MTTRAKGQRWPRSRSPHPTRSEMPNLMVSAGTAAAALSQKNSCEWYCIARAMRDTLYDVQPAKRSISAMSAGDKAQFTDFAFAST